MALLALGLGACSPDAEERPPAQSSSTPVVGWKSSAGGLESDTEKPPEQSEDPPQFDTVRARFFVFRDDFFLQADPYVQPSTLFALGDDGRFQEFAYDGIFFETDQLRNEPGVWILVRPNADTTVFPTLTAQDTTKGELNLPLVRKSILRDTLSLLSTPVDLDESAAQVLLRVVDSEGRPLAGFGVDGALGLVAIYQTAGFWTDWSLQTDDSGVLLVHNLPAPELPGGILEMTLVGTRAVRVEVPVLRGAVTDALAVVD